MLFLDLIKYLDSLYLSSWKRFICILELNDLEITRRKKGEKQWESLLGIGVWYLTVNVYICPFNICSNSLLYLPLCTYWKGTLPKEVNQYLQCTTAPENLKSCDEGLLLIYPLFKGMHTSNILHHRPRPVTSPVRFSQQLNYWRSSSLNFLFNISEDILWKSIY